MVLSFTPQSRRTMNGATRERLAGASGWIVMGLGIALAVGMWLQDTPAGSLQTWGDRAISVGQLTALVGTWMLLVTVLLMARVPWIERQLGLDQLAVWHGR